MRQYIFSSLTHLVGVANYALYLKILIVRFVGNQCIYLKESYVNSGNAVLSITRRNTKLERTPVTPVILVIRLSSKSW